jgi:copper chaperone
MTLQLNIPKLVCSGCVKTVTKAIKAVDANATIEANPKTKVVSIETQSSEIAIKEAIAAVGYPSA